MKKKSVMQEDFEKFLKSLPKKVFVNTESDNGDWWYIPLPSPKTSIWLFILTRLMNLCASKELLAKKKRTLTCLL